MPRRQTEIPETWLVIGDRLGADVWPALRRLPRGSGILLVDPLPKNDERCLHRIARALGDVMLRDGEEAVRVHNPTEIARARLGGAQVLLVSPLFATRSHPGQLPLPRMRAAALARLAGGRAIALGGMDRRRFAQVKQFGFVGWAGIDAWLGKRRA